MPDRQRLPTTMIGLRRTSSQNSPPEIFLLQVLDGRMGFLEAGGHLIAFRGQDGIEFQPRCDFHRDPPLTDDPDRFEPEGMEAFDINEIEVIGHTPAQHQTAGSIC
jgi:hypothetical protein